MLYFADMKLGKRLDAELKERGMAPVALCALVPDLSIGTLCATMDRDSGSSKFAPAIADALGLNLRWLLTGEGEKTAQVPNMAPLVIADDGLDHSAYTGKQVRGADSEPSNFEPGPSISRQKVPLISNVQAGNFAAVVDNFHPGQADEWVEVTGIPVNRYTFALRVTGDSMEPDFPAGMILVVEPELDPLPGDFVIAKNGSEEATFKQLVRDGADWYLKPLNPRYPIKPLAGCTIVGVVRQVTRRLR